MISNTHTYTFLADIMRICLVFNSNIPFIGELDFASSWLDFSANLPEITGKFLFPFSVRYHSWFSQVKDGLDRRRS